jgi:hypothetical protein
MPFWCFEFFQKDFCEYTCFLWWPSQSENKKKGDNIIPILIAYHQNLFYLGKSITTTTCWEADKVGVFKREGQIYQYYLHTRLLLVCHVVIIWQIEIRTDNSLPFLAKQAKSGFVTLKKFMQFLFCFKFGINNFERLMEIAHD